MVKLFYEINNRSYTLIINKKNIKNLYIRVDEELNIKVSAPYFYSKNKILSILKENEKSVLKMIKNQTKKNENNLDEYYSLLGKKMNVEYTDCKRPKFVCNVLYIKDDDMLDRWYKNKAKDTFKKHLDEVYYKFDEKIPYPKLKIRKMKTRWGVCNRKDNSVTLNLDLIKKDKKYLNYVIVHEVSHFVFF